MNMVPACGWTVADADKLQGPGWKYSQDLSPVPWTGHCLGAMERRALAALIQL